MWHKSMSLGDRDPQYQAKPVRKLLYEGIERLASYTRLSAAMWRIDLSGQDGTSL